MQKLVSQWSFNSFPKSSTNNFYNRNDFIFKDRQTEWQEADRERKEEEDPE